MRKKGSAWLQDGGGAEQSLIVSVSLVTKRVGAGRKKQQLNITDLPLRVF